MEIAEIERRAKEEQAKEDAEKEKHIEASMNRLEELTFDFTFE